jgi:Skp family chaperone for outer membrane proteins
MKRIIVFPAVLLLLFLASANASAQTRPGTAGAKAAPSQPAPGANAEVPDTRIGLADTGMFADEKAGIKRYVNAVKKVEGEFQPRTVELNNLQTRINTIADDISKLSGNSVVGPQTIQAKQEEGQRLQRELKYKKEQADADFANRFKEVVGPVSADIGKALDQYASKHGLTMILDISKLAPAVLTVNPSMDITLAFIAEYNAANP